MSLDSWYHVTFDNEFIYRVVNPPNQESWNDKLRWENIIRICFHPSDFLETDEIYIFTNKREESYLIPLEADGGSEFWSEIIGRNFFDAELAIKAATASDGLYCWPED